MPAAMPTPAPATPAPASTQTPASMQTPASTPKAARAAIPTAAPAPAAAPSADAAKAALSVDPPPGLVIPAAPTTIPSPPLPARIPYSEWKGPRPRAVRLGFTLIMLAGLISLFGGVKASRIPVTELPPIAAPLERVGVNAGDYTAVMQAALLAASLVAFGLYVLFACMIREGRNWARIGGSLLAAAALVVALKSGSETQVVAVLVAGGGLALMYRQDCARYFRPRRSQYLATD